MACLFLVAFLAARILVPEKPAKEVIVGAVSERLLGAKNDELPWPPKKDKIYSNLDLLALSGKSYTLKKLKGEPFIVIPIDMRSANSQVQAGAQKYGSLNGIDLKIAVAKSLESQIGNKLYLQAKIVHLILYNHQGEAPTAKDLRSWKNHFGLGDMRNHVVLGARKRHILWSKKNLTYGCQYVNAEFQLEVDATRGSYRDIKNKIKPKLLTAMQK